MAGTQPRTVLKRRPWRTAEVQGDGAEAVFVKRFHDPRWLRGWRDRIRAGRERRRLLTLARAGLPVPEVLELRATDAGWELCTRWITGARTVDQVLAARARPAHALAAALGRILGRLHASGLSHGDLHAGNAVVAADGSVWLVDAAALRTRTRSRMLADLATVAAAARERTDPPFRARFLVAWLRALPPALRASLPEPAALAERIEREARLVRRRAVERASLRWLRESGVCARVRTGGLELLHAHDLAPEQALSLARAALALDGDAAGLVLLGPRRTVQAAWRTAARLAEHGVPCLQPRVLVLAPRAVAVFAPPQGWDADAWRRATRSTRASGLPASERGRWAGLLADRGLRLAADADLFRAGALTVAGHALRLQPCDAPLRAFEQGLREKPAERARFAAAFLGSLRGSRRERAALRARLARG